MLVPVIFWIPQRLNGTTTTRATAQAFNPYVPLVKEKHEMENDVGLR